MVRPADDASERQRAVLAWFDRNGRDLPWRQMRDPWAILVSELMLQQTQVARVLDRWPRFLTRFPDPAACAAAPAADVISEWAGLGYNRRAVQLHRCATALVDHHDGRLPSDLDELLALPGVGPYTARAIRVFAFEADDAVVDTNVGRILARITGRPLGRAEVQTRADALVPAGHGWTWNQALLDVGATRCRSKTWECDGCPFVTACAWRDAGHPEPDPARGSAAVAGGQSPFEGSDRQGRARLVDALRAAPVPDTELASVMGWPDDPARVERVATTVVRDGLAVRLDGEYRLPDGG